jgi:hypothetical protein
LCVYVIVATQEKAKQKLSEGTAALPRDRLGFVGNLLLKGDRLAGGSSYASVGPGHGLNQHSFAASSNFAEDSLYMEGSSVLGSMVEEQNSIESISDVHPPAEVGTADSSV